MAIGVAFYHSRKDFRVISEFIADLENVSKIFVVTPTDDDGEEKAALGNRYTKVIIQLREVARKNSKTLCPPELLSLEYKRNTSEDLLRRLCIEIRREMADGRDGACKVDLSSANPMECLTIGRLSLVADIDVVLAGDDQPKIGSISTVVLLKDPECRIIDRFMESEKPFTNKTVKSELNMNGSTSSKATMYLIDTGCSTLDPSSGARSPAYRIETKGIYMRMLNDRLDKHRNIVLGGARTERRYKKDRESDRH